MLKFKGKTFMVEEPSHVNQQSLIHVIRWYMKNLVQRNHFLAFLFGNRPSFWFMEITTRNKSFRRIHYKRMSHIKITIYLLISLSSPREKKYTRCILPLIRFVIVYKEKSNLVSLQFRWIFKRQKSHIVHKYFRLVKRLNPEILTFYIYVSCSGNIAAPTQHIMYNFILNFSVLFPFTK